jgi:S1-C subfamily serine protease
VQFSDSEQVWPARLLATADGSDLAVVKVDNILGEVPTVQGVNLRADTLARGSAVALIGYPLGGDEETVMPDKRGHLVHPLLAAGILREASPSLLKVQGYGAAGASGSPIFDARGDVVGVLYGGRQEDGAQMLYAVPAAAMTRLLAGIHTLSSR